MARANKRTAGTRQPAQSQHALRITGGQWRGRTVHFPVVDGLRPTLAQPRERLFNWLQFDLAGRRVLDAFAGSGILGFEALSRGAARCDFIERDATAAAAIRQHLQQLQAGQGVPAAQVHQADVFTWLQQAQPGQAPYDVVFLDPPFSEQLFQQAVQAVAASGAVAPGSRVYLEAPRGFTPIWPPGWQAYKATRKGRLQQWLCRLDEVA